MIKVYDVSYVKINDRTTWKAKFVAEESSEIEKFLERYLGTRVDLQDVTEMCVINGISDSIVERIKEKYFLDYANKIKELEEEISTLRNQISGFKKQKEVIMLNEKGVEKTPKKRQARKRNVEKNS